MRVNAGAATWQLHREREAPRQRESFRERCALIAWGHASHMIACLLKHIPSQCMQCIHCFNPGRRDHSPKMLPLQNILDM